MNKLVIANILVLSSSVGALAQPAPPPLPPERPVSPVGTSPYVVPYAPPAVAVEADVDRSHTGFTIELAMGAGSSSQLSSDAGVTFAAGGWISRNLALAFRVSSIANMGFVGVSGQYYASDAFWIGAGAGQFSEKFEDYYGGYMRVEGTGGFVRAGYELGRRRSHALYISGEFQMGTIEDETRNAALLALGYQFL